MRRLLLGVMDLTCWVIDGWLYRVPGVRRLGCPNGLADWSVRLEERWGLVPR